MPSPIEFRIERFHQLSNNKWYYLMNYVIDRLVYYVRCKEADTHVRARIYKPDRCFYCIDRSVYKAPKLRFGQKTAEN